MADNAGRTLLSDRLLLRCVRLVIGMSARLLEGGARRDFVAEWTGEIWHTIQDQDGQRPARWHMQLSILRRLTGAPGHALWLRNKHKRSRNHSMDSIWQDFRQAFRRLYKAPSFALLAVAIIGLGIGANTAIFSIVNAVLFRPLPFADSDRVVRLFTSNPGGEEPGAISYPDFVDLRERDDIFGGAVLTTATIASVVGDDGAEAVFGEFLSADYFSLLGLTPSLGRWFLPEEDLPLSEPVGMISYSAWQRRYGGDPAVIGTPIGINGRPITIVGVGPRDFAGTFVGFTSEFWLPIGSAVQISPQHQDQLTNRIARGWFMIARLQDGVTFSQAAGEMATMGDLLGERYPDTNGERSILMYASDDVRIHPFLDAKLYPIAALLMAVVALVLVVACTNLANLLLVKAAGRRQEIAVRAALGAGRGRLIRHLLAESVILGVAGGIAGLVVARITATVIVSFKPPIPLPLAIDLSLDRTVLAFTFLLALATGVLFGLLPALRASRPDLVGSLKDEGTTTERTRRFGIRNVLVVTQVTVSVVLLTVAGLFVRALGRAQATDPGFETRSAALASFDLELGGYGESETSVFLADFMERVGALPGVVDVAVTDRAPLGASMQTRSVQIAGHETPDGEPWDIDFTRTSPSFFRTLGIPLTHGRAFDEYDVAGAPLVAIVSEAMAQHFWGTGRAVGQRLSIKQDGWQEVEVVGVASDIKVRTLGEEPRDYLYLPFAQISERFVTVIARTEGDPAAIPEAIRRELREINPAIPVWEAATMEASLAFALFGPRMGAMLLSAFGGLAVILAAIGLYGVVSATVAHRTREVGIRMALGATHSNVVGMVMREALWLVSVGAVLGLGLSILAARPLKGVLFGVPATDPATFLAVTGVLVLVAVVASGWPARRATRLDPVAALRSE